MSRRSLSKEEIGILKEADFDIDIYSSFNSYEREICLKLINLAQDYDELVNYYNESGWDSQSCKEVNKISKKVLRIINNSIQQKNIGQRFYKFLLDSKDNFEDNFEEILELEEKFIESENSPPEKRFLEEFWEGITSFLDSMLKILFWTFLIGLVFFFIFYKFFILPLDGKCYSNEDILECYFRVDIENQKIKDFNMCQQACGVGIGNEICLERCEYEYKMGKWKDPNSYVSSTGETIECPSTQHAYETNTGELYCN